MLPITDRRQQVVSNEFEAFEKGITLEVFVRFGTLRRGAPDWHRLADLDLQNGTSRLEYLHAIIVHPPHRSSHLRGAKFANTYITLLSVLLFSERANLELIQSQYGRAPQKA